jgi:hypothetical protein
MIEILIDELTNSIVERQTRLAFETKVLEATQSDIELTKDWLFDWKKEIKQAKVFKLITIKTPDNFEGLLSIEIRKGFVFVPLIENAPYNIGKQGKYIGVAGNLFAFACKTSFELGNEGYVSFVAKTELMAHYQMMLGAEVLFGNNMVIKTNSATKLIQKYFK